MPLNHTQNFDYPCSSLFVHLFPLIIMDNLEYIYMLASGHQSLKPEGPFQDLHLYPGVSVSGGRVDNIRYSGS
jgi:hypothetical protein